MTPKQKKQKADDLKMLKFLGVTKDCSNLNPIHRRRIIEQKKQDVLNALGINEENGLIKT